MLATILDIGKEPNTSKPKLAFQPIFFDTSRKVPFFLELFSRSLWLLSKTKNEMKATTNKETIKVMKVLEKQVTMVLEKRPRNFQELTNLMIKTNYEVVKKQWQNEHEEEFKSVLDTNPAVQELKQEFLKLNDKVMVEQRMNFMKNGSVFNRLIDAKKYDHCFIELTENRKQFLIYDYDEKQKLKVGKPEIIMIPTIDYLVQGKACPHPTNTITKDLRLVFSLITELKRYINLVANNLKNAFYWTDGFNILLEKEPRSEIYNEELQELVKMDLSLHLLDLQDITIPKQAPRIPTSPYVIEKPPLPQKSPGLLALKRPKYMTKSKETGKCQNLIDDIYI